MVSLYSYLRSNYVWVGATDLSAEDNWLWLDTTEVYWDNWYDMLFVFISLRLTEEGIIDTLALTGRKTNRTTWETKTAC